MKERALPCRSIAMSPVLGWHEDKFEKESFPDKIIQRPHHLFGHLGDSLPIVGSVTSNDFLQDD
jgi:hypothetical protein